MPEHILAQHLDSPSEIARGIKIAKSTPMDVATRIKKITTLIQDSQDDHRVDALLVTDLLNIRYLTGFTGGAGLVAITPNGVTLVTDGRYGELAQADIAGAGGTVNLEVTRDYQREAIVQAMGDAQRIGLEANNVSWSTQQHYATDWFPGKDLVPTTGWIERIRFIKDAGEIARIRAAANLADHVLSGARTSLADGLTEREFQWLLDDRMRALGSETPAFPTIVAAGPNASLPHHRPGDRVISEGDLVLIDFGGTIDGYRSDISRTFMVGEVSMQARDIFDLTLAAQEAGVAAVRAGISAAEVDRTCRSLIIAAGRGDQFIHSTGHGVGLFIHEDPFVSANSNDILEAGHVITVEPGVYVPGLGGVRIEDLVVVTEDGCEVLSHTTKSPSIF